MFIKNYSKICIAKKCNLCMCNISELSFVYQNGNIQ